MVVQAMRQLIIIGALIYSMVIQANILPNPGFETGSGGLPDNWQLVNTTNSSLNSINWITSDVHTGSYAIQLVGNDAVVGKALTAQSPRLPVPGGSLVNVSAWLKAIDVDRCGANDSDSDCKSWNHFRVTLIAFDINLNKLRHWDTVSTDGSLCGYENHHTCDWRNINSSIKLPIETDHVIIQFKLDHSTGTVWVDDASITVLQEQPAPDTSGISMPIVLPAPWQMLTDQSSALIGDVAISNSTNDSMLEAELVAYLQQYGVSADANPSDISTYATHILIGDSTITEISNHFSAVFPGNQWTDLGEQGYFLSSSLGSQSTVYLAGNTEQARFLGLQSLKQLISNGYLYSADILDKPDLNKRGMVMGVQWFNQYANAVDRFVSLKGNYILNHGSFMSNRFLRRWREPLTSSNLAFLQDYYDYLSSRFIEPHINIGPRSCSVASQCINPVPGIDYGPVEYSNDAEIDIVVEKIIQLYQIGYRTFGLTFDDMHNTGEDILISISDIKKFQNSIGKAHLHFTKQVYLRVTKHYPDIRFTLVPLWYGEISNAGDDKLAYIEELKKLPADIEMITVPNVDQGVDVFTQLFGRPTSIWTNYFAPSTNGEVYIMPFINQINWDDIRLRDFMFLPAVPLGEEPSLTSWYTSMGFAWSPYRYDALHSFNLNATRYERSLLP